MDSENLDFDSYLKTKYKDTKKSNYSILLIPGLITFINSSVMMLEGLTNIIIQIIEKNNPVKSAFKKIYGYNLNIKETIYHTLKMLVDENDYNNLEENISNNIDKLSVCYSKIKTFLDENIHNEVMNTIKQNN